MEKHEYTAKEELLKILNTVWSSRNEGALNACVNMRDNYIKKHGKDNVGILHIDIEISRQIRLNGLFANMGKVQDALQKQNAETKKKLEAKKKD